MAESVRDLVVRLSFEHGDTKQQISAINAELKLLDSGFAASAAMAAGFSGGLNQAGSAADQLRQKLSVQQQLVAKYGQAIEQANQKLQKSLQAHQQQGAEIERLKATQADLIGQKKALAAAMAAEKAANGESSAAYQRMAAEMGQLTDSINQTRDAIEREEAAFARSDRAINRNEQAVMRLTTEQNKAKAAMAETEAALQREEARIRNHADAWERAAQAAGRFAESAKGAGAWQTKTGGKLTRVSAAILGIGVAATNAAIDWESSFAGVRKTVDGTEAQLQQINDALLGMEVPTDFADLADIAANAGQLGIATDNVVGFTRTMADLAETTDLTAEAAAEGFAQYANITGMPQQNIDRLGSVTVELGNNLATTESKIVDFAQAIGSAGHQAGMTDQQIFGISGGLASLGLEARAGGTAFSKAIIGMQVAVETGSKDLAKYAEVAGMTGEEFRTAFGQDAAGTFIKFVEGLSSGSKSAIVMLDEMGITETRLRDTLLRASNASALMTKSVDMANSAWAENAALTNEAAVRYNTTASRMKMAGKQAQKVAMDFGKAIMPSLEQGLDGLGRILDRFNALDEAQRAGIIKWAAYAAAIGPALTLIGKANGLLGSAAGGFSKLAAAMAEGNGGLKAFLGSLGSLLGPAGILAAIGGIGLAAYKLYDYASGAKAAREATEALNKQAQAWLQNQAGTLYDTGNGNALARFGMTKEDFGASEREAREWMDRLTETWTDGKAETNQIVSEYVDAFKVGSDDVRGAIEGQADLLSEYGAMTPEARANLDADIQQLDAYDREVEALLKKRQNGTLTDEDQGRLNEILNARVEIQQKYELDTDGYDQIVTQMQAEIERLKSLGEEGGRTDLMGDTLNALAEGRGAYMDALNASYDAEYANIQTIEDETARQKALNALNERYNEQRLQGEEEYASAVKEAAATAWEVGGYEEQVGQIDEIVALLGDMEHLDLPQLQQLTAGLDEGQLASMLSLVEQLKASGMSDGELLDLGIDTDDLYSKIDAIRDLTEGVEGLEGLNTMFGGALPEEIQRIMIGLDMTQAASDWAAFAEGGSLAKIKPSLEEIDASAAVVTGTIIANGTLGTVTGADGKTYRVTGATVNADGMLATVTAEDGVTYTVTDGDVQADGTLATVTGADGKKYEVSGVKAAVDGELGTVTGADGKTYKVTGATVNADGTLASVTAEDGVTYIVDGANVQVQGTVTGPTANVSLNPLDQAAITAWENANKGVTITGPKAKVGVQLGAGWAGKLLKAYNTGMLAVYGEDGLPMTVTPEVVSQITAEDVAMLGEDGTIHVIVTPELGSEGGVAAAETAMEAKPGKGTAVEPLFDSTQDKVDRIRDLADAIGEYGKMAEEARDVGDVMLGQTLDDSALQTQQEMTRCIQELGDTDLSNVGGQIINLMAALESGEGTPEQLAEWEAQLQELLTFVETIGQEDYTSTGTNVMEGIAQGMAAYGWAGDAGSVASAVQAALNGAFVINSPSKLMEPTGQGVSEGIAQGMKGYDIAGDAAAVATGITGAFGSLPGQAEGIGRSFDAGLARGIAAGRSGVISAAIQVAQEAARAAKEALEIHSPSRVTEEMGRMFDLGFARGIEAEMPRISSAAVEALTGGSALRGGSPVVRQSTDNRDMSVSAPINIDRLEVRDDRDIEALSSELYGLIRRDQRLLGARR